MLHCTLKNSGPITWREFHTLTHPTYMGYVLTQKTTDFPIFLIVRDKKGLKATPPPPAELLTANSQRRPPYAHCPECYSKHPFFVSPVCSSIMCARLRGPQGCHSSNLWALFCPRSQKTKRNVSFLFPEIKVLILRRLLR